MLVMPIVGYVAGIRESKKKHSGTPGSGLGADSAAVWKVTDLAVIPNGVCGLGGGVRLGSETVGCSISMRLMWRAAAASVNILGANGPSIPGMALALDGGGSLICL